MAKPDALSPGLNAGTALSEGAAAIGWGSWQGPVRHCRTVPLLAPCLFRNRDFIESRTKRRRGANRLRKSRSFERTATAMASTQGPPPPVRPPPHAWAARLPRRPRHMLLAW